MKIHNKITSAIMAGVYIGIGATAYIALCGENIVAAAVFFAVGIMLVSSYHNMLATRVFALFPYKSENYSVADIFTALLFNGVGCIIYAWLLSITRFGNAARLYNLENIINSRFTDSYAGIFVMAIFCGFLVACGCLTGKSFPENKAVSMALTVFFIATFVIIAPEHIVADYFFFAYWSISGSTFTPQILPILLFSALGNAVGGIGAGYLDLIRRKGG